MTPTTALYNRSSHISRQKSVSCQTTHAVMTIQWITENKNRDKLDEAMSLSRKTKLQELRQLYAILRQSLLVKPKRPLFGELIKVF